jgi:hypothetical protein
MIFFRRLQPKIPDFKIITTEKISTASATAGQNLSAV